MSKARVTGFGLSLDGFNAGLSRASVIHSVAAVALAIAIVGVAGVSRATDEQFGNYFCVFVLCRSLISIGLELEIVNSDGCGGLQPSELFSAAF